MKLSWKAIFHPVMAWATATTLLSLIGAQTPEAAQVSANNRRSTPSGVTFIAPVGWSIRVSPSSVMLDAPEKDSYVAIADVRATDAAGAVGAVWAAYRPEVKRPIKLATSIPALDGWDERLAFTYEVSPNERAVVAAIASRAGDVWTVAILDGTVPTFEKRGAQLSLILTSLRPRGYQRESFAGRKALPLNHERTDQLKSFVEVSMKKLGIPGASLALIDSGQVVYEGGLGVRELGQPLKVDADTLFMAASNTKAMTTLLLSMLADEEKLQWEQPVTELYPAFKLGDPETTRQVLVKHLVCACTGLPRQDMEWLFAFKNATPASSLALLGTIRPTSRIGEVFQYSNLMAAAAGYIGAYLSDPSRELGSAYDEAMEKRIFAPLGMTSTTFDMARAQKANHASPHGDDVDGKPAVADMALNYAVVPHRPAGGVWTSAHDLIRYVQMELARGKLPNGRQLVSEENLLMRRQSQIPIGEDKYYGMGLIVNSTWGVPVVHHGGSLIGYKSDMIFLPDQGIGAVLLTNAENGELLLRPFMRRLLEVAFDGEPAAEREVDSEVASYQEGIAEKRERMVVPAAADEAAKLAPHYNSSTLGEIVVRRGKKTTEFDFGEWKSSVASRKNDDGTVSFITIGPAVRGFEFVVAEATGKRALILREGQHEYVFNEDARAQ